VKSKLLLLVVAFLLLAPPLVVSQSVTKPSKVPIGLGFSPSTIEPVGLETPVYTTGDALWVQSYSADVLTLDVNSPQGNVSLLNFLQPGALADIYTFPNGAELGAEPGNWTVSVFDESTGKVGYTYFTLVNSVQALTPRMAGANLTGSHLNLDLAIPATAAYAIQACTLGAVVGPTSAFQLPSGLGTTFDVSLNGTSVIVKAPELRAFVSVWAELYTARSYQNGTTLVSVQTLAARSEVATAYGAPLDQPLVTEMNLRAGRYDLRSYVRSPSGLLLFEAPYLLTADGQWISLQGCTQLSTVDSDSFVMESNLAMGTSTWPRSVLLMYTSNGVDGSTQANVSALDARVELLPYSQGKLAGVGGSVSGGGVENWDSFNGSVYLIGQRFPLQAQIDVSYEGLTAASTNITMAQPYSVYVLESQDGGLTLHASLNGAPVANTTVYLSGQGNSQVPFLTNGAGNFSLFLPPGGYNLTASFGGHTASASVRVSANSTGSGLLDFGSQLPAPLLIALVAGGVAAGGVNVFVWTSYIRRRRLTKPGNDRSAHAN
jgi:hypothetical protein